MKKVILFLILGSKLFSKEIVDLDTVLKETEIKSYTGKIYKVQKENIEKKEKYYKYGDYNGIKTQGSYSDTSGENGDYKAQGRVEYGNFYIEGNKYNNDEVVYGAEKSIKELLYSTDKNKLKQLKYDEGILEKQYQDDLIGIKKEVINLYKNIINSKLEILVNKTGIEVLEKEKKKLEKAYKLGEVSRIELEDIENNMRNLSLKIEIALKNITTQELTLYNKFGVDIRGKVLENIENNGIDIEKLLSNYKSKNLEILNLQLEKQKENIKYLKYDKYMPDISVGIERNSRTDSNRVFAKFSKTLFDYNYEYENEEDNIDMSKIKIEQEKKNDKNQVIQMRNSYEELLSLYSISKNNYDLDKKKYEIKKLEYSLGKIDYLEVMEQFDKYIASEIEMKKNKNNLNSFIYEMKVMVE